MSCPTCGNALTLIAAETLTVWHCERCGTVVMRHFAEREPRHPRVPVLVERCRVFAKQLGEHALHSYEWRRLGIAEAINHPPAERTPTP